MWRHQPYSLFQDDADMTSASDLEQLADIGEFKNTQVTHVLCVFLLCVCLDVRVFMFVLYVFMFLLCGFLVCVLMFVLCVVLLCVFMLNWLCVFMLNWLCVFMLNWLCVFMLNWLCCVGLVVCVCVVRSLALWLFPVSYQMIVFIRNFPPRKQRLILTGMCLNWFHMKPCVWTGFMFTHVPSGCDLRAFITGWINTWLFINISSESSGPGFTPRFTSCFQFKILLWIFHLLLVCLSFCCVSVCNCDRAAEGGRGGGGRWSDVCHRRSLASPSWLLPPVLWRGSTRRAAGLRSVELSFVSLGFSGDVQEFKSSCSELVRLQETTGTAGSWSSSAAAVCLHRTSSTTGGCSSTSTRPSARSKHTRDAERGLTTCLCCRYLKFTLDQYVEMDYILVYFHHGLRSSNKPSMKWLREAYTEFDRKCVPSLSSWNLETFSN